MPKYGANLEQYFNLVGKTLSIPSIMNIGVKVLDLLEQVHNADYIYGDLKLDNLLFGHRDLLPKVNKADSN